jgi:hypothetical protein
MATFNFAEAIKTAKTEHEFWKLAAENGVSIDFVKNGYKFKNLGSLEGHNAFLVKGVLSWFNSCDFRGGFSDHDNEFLEEIALMALYRAYEAFQKFNALCIDTSKPSNLTFSSLFNLIWKDRENEILCIGSYTDIFSGNIEKLSKIANELNLSMEQVAVWCGMDACFATSNCGELFLAEDEGGEKHLCENYTNGIVMEFETKKRKRDEDED